MHRNFYLVQPPDVSRDGLYKFYPWTLFIYLCFYQSTVLSSHAVNSHQIYFRGSVVGKASTVCREVLPTTPLIFKEIKKCEIWRRFQHHSTFSRLRLKMQQDIRILKQKYNAAMIAICLCKIWWNWVYAPQRKLCQLWSTPSLKLHDKRAKSSITQPWIIRFRSNFVWSLNAWHPKCLKVPSQEVKGQGHSVT